MDKISAVYQIINTVTGDRYVGSSRNVMHRWADHRCPSSWKKCPDNPLYKDFQKYGLDKFRFQILAPVMPEYLKQVEQEFIEMLHPAYNDRRAKGLDVERQKEHQKEWRWSNKEYCKEYRKEYRQTEKGKEAHRKDSKKYFQSEKGRKTSKKYKNQLCSYNGETLTLNALYLRFHKAGVEHPALEAKKYLISENKR